MYEMLFKLSTTRVPHDINILYIALFSGVLGLLISAVLSSLTTKVSRIVSLVISVILPLPYLIEYFIFRQFKVIYDINTIINGSEGAMTGFGDHIAAMVFSASGLLMIAIYLLPVAACIFLLVKNINIVPHKNWKWGLSLVGGAIVCLLLALVLINTNTIYRNAYSKEYNYEKSVSDFGLLTGLRQDFYRMINPSSDNEFVATGTMYTVATSTPTPLPTEPPITAAPNNTATPTPTPSPSPTPFEPAVMDFDFAAMAEETSGTIHNLNEYVASLEPSYTNEYTGLFAGKNLIIITAEAFTAEVIDEELTPTLYRMATRGINFEDHYVPATAGTTGGEFSHITGFLPVDGGSSMMHYVNDNVYLTMGSQLGRLGYYGIMYHNNDYTYYTRNVTHNMLGYSEGFVGWGNGLEDYVDPVWPESDLQMFEATVPTYIDQQQFCVYYMTVSGHSGYSHGSNAQARAHWEEVEDLPYSSRVQAYIGANLELEYSMRYLIEQLEEAGIADDTVIVINADHFPYGLDNDAPLGRLPYTSELYGVEEITDYFTRDHNRLIIWSGCLEDMDPIVVTSPTTTLDVLPTLSNLFGLEWDSRLLPGRDVFSNAFPVAYNMNYDWRTDLGTYYSSRALFVPFDENAVIPDDYVEQVRAYVANKISFMRNVMNADYYGYLFDSLTEE